MKKRVLLYRSFKKKTESEIRDSLLYSGLGFMAIIYSYKNGNYLDLAISSIFAISELLFTYGNYVNVDRINNLLILVHENLNKCGELDNILKTSKEEIIELKKYITNQLKSKV